MPGVSKILTIVSTLHDTDLACIQAEDEEEVGATGARPSSFLSPNKRKRERRIGYWHALNRCPTGDAKQSRGAGSEACPSRQISLSLSAFRPRGEPRRRRIGREEAEKRDSAPTPKHGKCPRADLSSLSKLIYTNKMGKKVNLNLGFRTPQMIIRRCLRAALTTSFSGANVNEARK